jgi:hypothetical protein
MRKLTRHLSPFLLALALPFTLGPSCDSEKERGQLGDAASDDNALQGAHEGTPKSDAASPPGERPEENTGARCGTRGGITCKDDEFCSFPVEPTACGALDGGGSCQPKPEVCDTVYAPVCGCDGKTYSSDCTANAAGVSVSAKGECKDSGEPPPAAGKTCGGFGGLRCGSGEFCNYEPAAGGQGCDGSIADAAGKCEVQPKACTREYRPVCGCDRKSYATACTAHSSGMSVLHEGACTEVDCKALGGRAVNGIGPAPKCEAKETNHTWIVYSSGQIAVEGTICCLP